MPTLPIPEVPADASFEELASIVGETGKTLAWLMGQVDKDFVQQRSHAGRNLVVDHGFEMLPKSQWTKSTAYVVDDMIVTADLNGYIYKCTVAGTSGATAPVWPTVIGNTVVDGTVTWRCEAVAAVQEFPINAHLLGNVSWWMVQGFPRIRSTYQTDTTHSLFGNQSLLVNNTNYAWQRQGVFVGAPLGPYCLSSFVSPKGGNTAGAKLECTLTIRALDGTNPVPVELGSVSRTFTVSESYSSSDDGKWTRGFVTYQTLPVGTVLLQVEMKSATGEWLEIDGVQLVPKETPEAYNPEDQLWAHLHSLDGARHLDMIHLGTLTLMEPAQTYFAHVTPGAGGTNKTLFDSADGFEFRTAVGGSLMLAMNNEAKNWVGWLQLQDNNATTSPAIGALRSNTAVPQFYDGVVWQRIPFQAAAQANNATANAATQGPTYDQAAVQSIADLANSLKSDLNALLAKLRTAGVIAT